MLLVAVYDVLLCMYIIIAYVLHHPVLDLMFEDTSSMFACLHTDVYVYMYVPICVCVCRPVR